ncbi:MAG TPA: hypothetical protein VFF13_00665 [archaeon]|nr:hypothetical protein [archaeon]
MFQKFLVFLACILLFSGIVFAENDVEAANEFISKYPDFFGSEIVQTLFGSERMNITINLIDGSTEKYGVVTEDGEVVEVQKPMIENPTVNITANEEALLNISAALFDPQVEIQKQLDSKGLSYEPIGIVSVVKFGAAGLINSISLFFRNLFAPPQVFDNCYSEDGDNSGEQGITMKGSRPFPDVCESASQLKEYYCSPEKDVTFKFYECDCVEGICAE